LFAKLEQIEQVMDFGNILPVLIQVSFEIFLGASL